MLSDLTLHAELLILLWCIVACEFFGAALIFKKVNASGTSAILGFLVGGLFFQSRRTPVYVLLIIPGCLLGFAGLLLFLWAARTIHGRFFSYILSDDEPQFVLNQGPFAYVRHPFYTSYMLTQFGGLLIFPSWITLALFLAMVLFFWWASNFEEQKFASSTRSSEYLSYKYRTGRFVPRFKL